MISWIYLGCTYWTGQIQQEFYFMNKPQEQYIFLAFLVLIIIALIVSWVKLKRILLIFKCLGIVSGVFLGLYMINHYSLWHGGISLYICNQEYPYEKLQPLAFPDTDPEYSYNLDSLYGYVFYPTGDSKCVLEIPRLAHLSGYVTDAIIMPMEFSDFQHFSLGGFGNFHPNTTFTIIMKDMMVQYRVLNHIENITYLFPDKKLKIEFMGINSRFYLMYRTPRYYQYMIWAARQGRWDWDTLMQDSCPNWMKLYDREELESMINDDLSRYLNNIKTL